MTTTRRRSAPGALMADQPIHPTLTTLQPTGKNIVICCDGTGNEFGDCNSNVLKLYTTLDLEDETRQVAYYHPGVGTMGDPGIRHWIPRKWSVVKGLAFGAGFKDNVFDAYRYLMEVYNEGDHIYLFGFSRGAYTARALAGLLHGYGLLHRGQRRPPRPAPPGASSSAKSKSSAVQLKKRSSQPQASNNAHTIARPDTALRQHVLTPVRLRFVGVWDTVSSIGWIYEPLRLLSLAQNEIIDVARHAASIDERRAFFRDNLYGPPVNDKQDIAQLWFPGVHSDVGGSYPREDSDPALATLRWMLGEASEQAVPSCARRPRRPSSSATPSAGLTLDQYYHAARPHPFTNSTAHSTGNGGSYSSSRSSTTTRTTPRLTCASPSGVRGNCRIRPSSTTPPSSASTASPRARSPTSPAISTAHGCNPCSQARSPPTPTSTAATSTFRRDATLPPLCKHSSAGSSSWPCPSSRSSYWPCSSGGSSSSCTELCGLPYGSCCAATTSSASSGFGSDTTSLRSSTEEFCLGTPG